MRRCEARINETDPPCEETAIYEFLWDWGTHGFCCEAHRGLLQQLATQSLQRQISFRSLQPSTSSAPSSPSVDSEETRHLKAVAKLASDKATSLLEENGKLGARVRELENELEFARTELAKHRPSELTEVERKTPVQRGPHK